MKIFAITAVIRRGDKVEIDTRFTVGDCLETQQKLIEEELRDEQEPFESICFSSASLEISEMIDYLKEYGVYPYHKTNIG